ncbi:MAG TPA: hypothetical protein PLC47_09795, partial [Bacteroidales bacterium]|nr:hypothetical protein [Bacteroidales bacterium]
MNRVWTKTWLILWMGLQLATIGAAQPKDRWHAGSAKDLKGEVLTLYVFLETDAAPWSSEDKKTKLAELGTAQQWLVRQASKWDVLLEFARRPLGNNESIQLEHIPTGTGSGKERVDWAKEILKKSGYRNARQAYRKLSRKTGFDNLQLLFFANTGGISYAMRYAKNINKRKYFMEAVLIYQRYDNDAHMPVEAIIAHEILHLYGAWDLYTTYAQTTDRH